MERKFFSFPAPGEGGSGQSPGWGSRGSSPCRFLGQSPMPPEGLPKSTTTVICPYYRVYFMINVQIQGYTPQFFVQKQGTTLIQNVLDKGYSLKRPLGRSTRPTTQKHPGHLGVAQRILLRNTRYNHDLIYSALLLLRFPLYEIPANCPLITAFLKYLPKVRRSPFAS